MFSKLSALALLAVALQASTATACIQALACWAPAEDQMMFANFDLSEDGNAVCGVVPSGLRPGAWANSVVRKTLRTMDGDLVSLKLFKTATNCNGAWKMEIGVTHDPSEDASQNFVDVWATMPNGKELRGRILPSLGTRKIGGRDMQCGAFAWMEGEGECKQEWKDGMGFIGDYEAYYAEGGNDKITVISDVIATFTATKTKGPALVTRTMWAGAGFRNH